jgi:hypothetical protein
LLKRDDAARQTEEWHLHIFQAKAVKVCDVPQEKGEIASSIFSLKSEREKRTYNT